ncbi:MAG: hypothetical protein V3V06_03050, partial [Dehalococcoidia bacterium]
LPWLLIFALLGLLLAAVAAPRLAAAEGLAQEAPRPPAVDDGTITHTQRVAVGGALSAELQCILAPLGTEIKPCAPVDEPARADLLIWGYGEPEPVTPFNADLDASFLGAPNSRPTPPPEASGGQGGGPALLPAAGSGGLADGDSYKDREAAAWLTALGATALMAIVAVAVTRRMS